MKRTCWLLALLLAYHPAEAEESGPLRIRISHLQGLLDMARSYCGGQGESVALQRLLESAGHRSGEPPEAMVRFCSVDIGRNAAGLAGRHPAYDSIWSSPWQHALNASVRTTGIASLLDETAGAFTLDEQQALADGLRYVEPLYRRLVEDRLGAEAKHMGDSLSSYMAGHDVASLMRSLSTFYATPWPDDMPIWVGLSPLPAGSGGFSATANGNVIRSFMPVDYDRPDIYSAVIWHEFGHLLYANMPAQKVDELAAAFNASSSPRRRFAEIWLNEALATAAGNGWVYRRLNGTDEHGDWYDSIVIDPYAKAIAPAVHGALDAGRALDGPMVEAFVAGFDAAHPDALRDPEVILPHAAIVADADDRTLAELRAIYFRQVNVRRVDAVRPGARPDAELPPTVLRVEFGRAGTDDKTWHRQIRSDGGLTFSTLLDTPAAFEPALTELVALIRADTWDSPDHHPTR